jgi:phenylacetate-coenzyme A ligase PaaK-like adenylate-forming protein
MDTRAQLDLLKLDKFRALVRHANAHSPYYANLIRERAIDIGTCVPEDFPVLTKSLLMAHFDDIVTDRRLSRKVVADFLTRSSNPGDRLYKEFIVMHTSGTSGEVGYFLYAPGDYKRMNAGRQRNGKVLLAFLKKRTRRLQRISVAFYGATGGHYAGVTSLALMQRGLLRLFVRAAAFEVNTPLPAVVAGLNDFQPELLFGYTTALRMLADEQRAGRLRIAPIVVMASGEVTTSNDMNVLSDTFGGATTLSIYACTEHMALGHSNPDGETMTLADDNLFFELHADHTIVTNLFNYTMPLIRYRMSDILQQVSPPEAPHIVIRNLVGRSELLPTFQNSAGATDFLSPHTINEIFVQGVTRFQMRLTGPATFRFPVCVEPGLDEAARAAVAAAVAARLNEILAQKGLGNVTFETLIVDEIPLNTLTRKFQLIVDERDARTTNQGPVGGIR